MIFKENEIIMFDDHFRECICCNEGLAVFATFTSSYWKENGEYIEDKNVLSFNNLFVLSNEDADRNLMEFERINSEQFKNIIEVD